jgi:hypothetical protein
MKGTIMNKHLLNARFSFLYAVISAVAVGCAMTFSWIAGLNTLQTVLLLIGALLGAWATLFSFLEIRRLAQRPKSVDEAFKEEADPYAPRTVVVEPPTGAPYPHHEDYPESAGLEEGQLCSRLADPTPLIEDFLNRRSMKKLKARASEVAAAEK